MMWVEPANRPRDVGGIGGQEVWWQVWVEGHKGVRVVGSGLGVMGRLPRLDSAKGFVRRHRSNRSRLPPAGVVVAPGCDFG